MTAIVVEVGVPEVVEKRQHRLELVKLERVVEATIGRLLSVHDGRPHSMDSEMFTFNSLAVLRSCQTGAWSPLKGQLDVVEGVVDAAATVVSAIRRLAPEPAGTMGIMVVIMLWLMIMGCVVPV